MSAKKSKAKAPTGSRPRDLELIVEKDVRIPMRDGAILYADVFRPDGGDERFPAIMNISVYQKDKLWVPRTSRKGRIRT
jgi:predicted acyl esterase